MRSSLVVLEAPAEWLDGHTVVKGNAVFPWLVYENEVADIGTLTIWCRILGATSGVLVREGSEFRLSVGDAATMMPYYQRATYQSFAYESGIRRVMQVERANEYLS